MKNTDDETEEIVGLLSQRIITECRKRHGFGELFFRTDGLEHEERRAPPNARLVLSERNAEVRREIIRKVGIERVCAELNARRVDAQGDYELLLLDLQDGRLRPFLKMRNPSVPGVYHVEGVAPECQTVAQALAWRNQSDVPQSVLT